MTKKHYIAVCIFFTALVSGLFWNHRSFLQPPATGGDQWQYTCLARSILEGGYSECGNESMLEPLYPFFVAAIFSVTGENVIIVRGVQLILFGVLSMLVYYLASTLFAHDQRIAIASGGMTAVLWYFANFTGELLREIVLITLTLLSTFVVIAALKQKRLFYFVLAGVVIALVSLTNGLVVYGIPFLLGGSVLYLYRSRLSVKTLFGFMMAAVLAGVLTFTPWWLYKTNINTTSETTVAGRTGYTLGMRAELMQTLYPHIVEYYLGHLIGYYFVEQMYPQLDTMAFRNVDLLNAQYERYRANGVTAQEIDRLLVRDSIHVIVSHPVQYIAMSALDLLAFFNPIVPERVFEGNNYMFFTFAQGRHESVPTVVKIMLLLGMRVFWYSVLGLAIVGAVVYRKKYSLAVGVLVGYIIFHAAAHAAVYAIPRYATRIYPHIFILSAAGFWYCYNRWVSKYKQINSAYD